MVITDIFKIALQKSHTKARQITDYDSDMTLWFNLARAEFAKQIAADVGEQHLFTREYLNLAADTSEGKYDLPVVGSTQKLNKILNVFVKLTADGKYQKAKELTPSQFEMDWQTILDQGGDPVYFTSRERIYVAPQVDAPVTNGIELMGVANVTDITSSATEAEILIPNEYHIVIALKMVPYILDYRGKRQAALSAREEAIAATQEAVDQMSDRIEDDMFIREPDESHLEI